MMASLASMATRSRNLLMSNVEENDDDDFDDSDFGSDDDFSDDEE